MKFNFQNGPKLALGCEQLGGVDWGKVDIKQQKAAIRCAWECGVRIFDTADVYGLGRSEKELSKTLGNDRHDASIITKVGVRWNKEQVHSGRAKTYKDSSAKYLISSVEGSLERLRLDAIPFYLIHWPDENTPIEETLETLQKLQDSGKIKNFGLANFDYCSLDKILDLYKGRIAMQQTSYSLASIEKRRELKVGADHHLINTIYGPLSQGLLTGKYHPKSEFGLDDRRHRLAQFKSEIWGKNLELISRLKEISKDLNCQISDIALSWLFKKKYIDVVICGAKSPEQVLQNINSEKIQLTDEVESRLNRISANYEQYKKNI